MKPPVNPHLREVLPGDLVVGTLYLIESSYTSFDIYKFKGIFLENIIRDNTSDPPVIESRFRIQEYPQELAMHFRGDEAIGAIESFRNNLTRYYLAEAQEIMNRYARKRVFANMINTQNFDPTEEDLRNTKNDLGDTLANEYFRRAKKGGTKTKRTKRSKKGTKRKTKRTKRAKKGTKTKTKRIT